MHIAASHFDLALRWAGSLRSRADDDGAAGSATAADISRTWLQELALAISVFSPVLAFIVCGLRAYIRVQTKTLAADDWWIFGAMALSIVNSVCAWFFIVEANIGIHDADIPPGIDPASGYVWNFVTGLTYRPILGMVKLSILLFLLRLGGHKKWVNIFIWFQIWLNVISTVMMIFMYTFMCDPIGNNWAPALLGTHCASGIQFAIFSSSFTIFTDLLVLVVPFWIFVGLRMARKIKAAILVVFLLGIIVTAVGAVRLFFLLRSHILPKDPTRDTHFSIGFTTSVIESNLAIITASAPALWPLARRWFPGIFRGLGLSHGYQGHLPTIHSGATGGTLGKDRKPRSKISLRSIKEKFFIRGSSGRRSQGSGQGGGNWVHADHTIGGTSMAHNGMRGDKATARTEIRGRSPNESEEEMMTYNGIVWTRAVTVTRHDESPEPPQEPRPPPPSGYPRRKDISEITGH